MVGVDLVGNSRKICGRARQQPVRTRILLIRLVARVDKNFGGLHGTWSDGRLAVGACTHFAVQST